MIDETRYAFGLDGSRYWSANGLADFKMLAQARNPTVRFLAFRAVISWGYVDSFFSYHWEETKKIVDYRKQLVLDALDDFYKPVGRCAYGVLYPAESAQRQALHLLKTIQDTTDWDWTHDRLVIDAELHHDQNRARITDAINQYGETLQKETGRLPILYSRYYWLKDYTNVSDLLNFDMWYAQYLRPIPGIRFRAEYPPPPNPIFADRGWLLHQTAERGDPRPYGVTGKQVVDYNRWNGDERAVMDYFGFDGEPEQPPPLTLEQRVADNTRRIEILEAKWDV